MTLYQITEAGIFSLGAVSECEILEPENAHQVFGGAYHVYSFHVRAKFDPGDNLTTVGGATAQVANPYSTGNIISQTMTKETGDPTDFFYKTTSKITFGGSVALPDPTFAIAIANATFVTTELKQDESEPTDIS